MNDPCHVPLTAAEQWIERQPLLNREGNTLGYELRLASATPAQANPLDACAAILSHVLSDIGDSGLPVGLKLFMPLPLPVLLDEDFTALLPDERIVLALIGGIDTVDSAHLDCCDNLRRRGIGICLSDAGLIEGAPELLMRADYFKFDLAGNDPYQLYQRFSSLKGLPLQRIVSNISTNAQYRFCRDAGFDIFSGRFFVRPEIVERRDPAASLAALVTIFDLVGAEAPASRIEEAFKRDPALMLKFLGYINSAGMGLMRKVSSIAHAVHVLGYRQLYRWVALLLYSAGQGEAPAALMKVVLARARFLELVGSDIVPSHERETLFVIGMVSLLDVVFGRPLIEVVAKLPLPDAVVRAVIDHEGLSGKLLQLATALEAGDAESAGELADSLHLPPAIVMKLQAEAVGWAESFGTLPASN
jgi:EAL and modified HD-GYP domain-containing signal transduction protein